MSSRAYTTAQLYLSAPCVLVSFLLCIWSLLITFFTVLTYPLRLFSASRQPLSHELRSLLARSNRLQLRAIYSVNITQGKSVSSLLLVHALSPFIAMAVSLGAWAVALYWVFAAMIGDPDGTEGGNDGRATVLGLRAYWEMWLCKAMIQLPFWFSPCNLRHDSQPHSAQICGHFLLSCYHLDLQMSFFVTV